MFIIISSPRFFSSEGLLINRLFEEGMPLFHLRKPDASEKEFEKALNSICPVYRDKISIHQYHHLAEDYGIGRLHFSAEQRKSGKLVDGRTMESSVMLHSTSIHSAMEYLDLPPLFSYTFLSPVYDSISKPGYKAKQHETGLLKGNRVTKVIGLGGITAENCQQVFLNGFDGVGVSGAIWQSSQPIKEFIRIKQKCLTAAQL